MLSHTESAKLLPKWLEVMEDVFQESREDEKFFANKRVSP